MPRFLLFVSFFALQLSEAYGQDTLVKTDRSKLAVTILEVNPGTIKYKRFDYPEGPVFIVNKENVFEIIYTDGTKVFFKEDAVQLPASKNIGVADTLLPDVGNGSDVRVKDYIKFNVQLGMMLNNAYSNKVRNHNGDLSHLGYMAREDYSGYSNKLNTSIQLGFNFLFGRSPFVKHVIGVNYLRSRGEFNYSYESWHWNVINGNKTRYSQNLHYSSKVDFINLVSGIRLTLIERIHIEPLVSFNYVVHKDERITGSIGADPLISYYNNDPAVASKIWNTVSFCPKLSYQFHLKKQSLEAYASYNLAYEYRLPWWMFGLSWYPLKKLSLGISKRKIRFFRNARIGVDAGLTLNKSNAPKNRRTGETFQKAPDHMYSGFNLGMHLIQGPNNYFKSVTTVALVQSNTEFIRSQYVDSSSNQTVYKHRGYTNYKTNAYYLEVRTGLRIILFRHLNIDNTFGVNIPLYAQNSFNGYEVTDEYAKQMISPGNYNYVRTNSTSTPITEASSSEIFQEPAVTYHTRISFDLPIREQRVAIYAGYSNVFNFSLEGVFKSPLKWGLLGLSWYPFKTLR